MTKYRTRQEIFDQAYRGLASQEFEPSYDEEQDMCLYRAENGHRCGIGWCISDEDYTPSLEGEIASESGVRRAARIRKEDVRFACRLQAVHDKGVTIRHGLRSLLEKFAEEESLTIPSLETTPC